MSETRDAWVEVDLAALAANARLVSGLCEPAAPMGVVKANAYGHGAVSVARTLANLGYQALCVATMTEALELRAAGLSQRIVILYEVPARVLPQAIEEGFEITIGSSDMLGAIVGLPRRIAHRLRIQLKIETGLMRQGLDAESIQSCGRHLVRLGSRIAGIWTHLADGADPQTTDRQRSHFDEVVDTLNRLGVEAPRHVAASAAILTGIARGYEFARPGLALYGAVSSEIPDGADWRQPALRPAMAVRARPIRVATVPSGTAVGYGGAFVTRRRTRLMTLPVGYADGLPRQLGPTAFALVNGARAPLVGRISMDACTADVTDAGDVARDTVVTLLGTSGKDSITLENMSRWARTIPQDVAVGLGRRLDAVHT